ncbi:ATP-binding protein [Streptomyces oryzae]|uniref:ATP-binding protein n=2 Tax=Streptomyces oryzae TaxID=1434886 RepID=A0ABS3X9K7_9ACTN|nr:ATP-binding protein [Streptomyces oryzae]
MERHGSDRYAHGDGNPPAHGDGNPPTDRVTSGEPDSGTGGEPARAVRLVADQYLVTVNPVDGSEIEPCPPGEQRATPPKLAPQDRPAPGTVTAAAALPPGSLLERDEERERLSRLLSRGRSVRLTGPAGSGRSVLLDAVAADVASLAPDGVVRLSGYHRTPSDLMYDLFAAVHSAPLHRPGKAELISALGGIGAVVIVDDLEFGGAALDELLRATPECAFLFTATPDVAAPAARSHVEEVFLAGLSRTACAELLERAVHRQLTDDEADWAADLWFGSEGLPLRFVQAGALLRLQGSGGVVPGLSGDVALAPLLAAALSEPGRGALRLALALDGQLPHPAHLPALVGDPDAGDCLTELLASGLISPAGGHFTLAAGVAAQLAEAGFAEGGPAYALAAAQHYSWWAAQPSATTDRVALEADALLAAARGAQRAGNASAAVLLARTAAPVLAAGMRWSAWERVLRCGQEAARTAGEIAEEAYFHHELGILALSAGNPERARSELETALGLRGTLAEQRGMVAGCRALALVTDRLAGATPGPTPGTAALPAPGGSAAGGDTPVAGLAAAFPDPPGRPFTDTPALGSAGAVDSRQPDADAATTSVLSAGAAQQQPSETLVSPTSGAADAAGVAASGHVGGRHSAPRGWRAFTTRKRSAVVAGAGALIAAVVGTVVTLGTATEDGPPDTVRPDSTASQDDQDNAPGDESPEDGSPSGQPERQQPAAGKPAPGTNLPGSSQDAGTPGGGSSSPKGSSSAPEDPSSSQKPPSSPHDPPSSPHRPPSSSPDDPPSSQDPSPTPSGDPTSESPNSPSGSADNTTTGSSTPTDRSPGNGPASNSAGPSAS